MQIIAGTHRKQRIESPKGLKTRPTASMLRETLFNIVQNYVEGSNFLDLFAGSGAMGLEALSRGAEKAVFVDNNKEAFRCIQSNIKHLHLEDKAQVLQGDVLRMLEKLLKEGKSFTLIYADAPYAESGSIAEGLLEFVNRTSILENGGMFFIEDVEKSHLIENFKNLSKVSERRSGRAYLHQYRKTYA